MPTAPAPTPTPAPTIVPSPTPAAGQPTGAKKEVGIVSSKDNTLYQSNTGDLSNGAGEYLFVGRTNSGPVRRAVIAFDLASGLPAGAKVTSATLTMHMSKSQSGGTAVRLHRIAADWGEGKSKGAGEQGGGAAAAPGDATWIHRFFDSQKWARAGADFADTDSASVVVSLTGAYTWSSTAQLVADVQGWVDDPTKNFGWILIGDEANTQSTKRFDSREAADQSLRPMLTIEFVAP
ncbi:MAG: DNRLRE domain-containing protein [Chloroflexi bacterium]|nr:DNRLRE domain-containing protein [Chloroflexota bacterium]